MSLYLSKAVVSLGLNCLSFKTSFFNVRSTIESVFKYLNFEKFSRRGWNFGSDNALGIPVNKLQVHRVNV